MLDFSVSEEDAAIRELAHNFAEKEIRPIASKQEWIQDPAERFPWDIVEKASKLGFRTMTVPKEFGGIDASFTAMVLALEELAWGDLGVAIIFSTTLAKVKRIARLGTTEQKKWFFPKFMENDRYVLSGATSEPAHGTDTFIAMDTIQLDTNAKPDGNEWVLNGTKHFINNANEASLYFVTCTDLSQNNLGGRTVLMVPRDTPGVRVERVHEKISQRLSNNAEITFRNCRVPIQNELGTAASREAEVTHFAMEHNVQAAAMMLGVARAAYESALEYARNRVQGGKKIIEHQAIGMMLAEMATSLECMDAMKLRVTWEAEQPRPNFDLGPMAKYHASEASIKVCLKAVEVLGGSGIMMELPVQKYVRDSLSALHYDGTQQAALIRIMNSLIRDR